MKRKQKRELEKNKKKKKIKSFTKKIVRYLIYLILICLLIYSGSKIYKWYKENKNKDIIIDKINEAVMVEDNNSNDEKKYNIDFSILKEQNNETVAWIKVNNTNIEYPVVKTKNNDFYLTHSFDKSYNSAGWIFADYRNKIDGTDKNIIVYGHNRRDGSMFENLKKTINVNWYENIENRNIIFNTENENCNYEIFSIYQIETEEYYIQTEFKNEDEFGKFVEILKKRSVKNFETEVSSSDSILTLSTCANNNKYRVVVHAKKVLKGE